MWDLGHFSEIKTESATWQAALETRSGNYAKRPMNHIPIDHVLNYVIFRKIQWN